MKPIPSRLQLLVRSVCFKSEGLITDFEEIAQAMKQRKELNCTIEAKTQLSLAFSVEFEEQKYLVVFVHFPASALDQEDMDITISRI